MHSRARAIDAPTTDASASDHHRRAPVLLRVRRAETTSGGGGGPSSTSAATTSSATASTSASTSAYVYCSVGESPKGTISVDATHVYWTNLFDGGEIVRMKKP